MDTVYSSITGFVYHSFLTIPTIKQQSRTGLHQHSSRIEGVRLDLTRGTETHTKRGRYSTSHHARELTPHQRPLCIWPFLRPFLFRVFSNSFVGTYVCLTTSITRSYFHSRSTSNASRRITDENPILAELDPSKREDLLREKKRSEIWFGNRERVSFSLLDEGWLPFQVLFSRESF